MVISGDASAQYSFNGGSFTNAETPVSGGANTIAVRVTASATAGASVEANLSVGGASVKCVATTRTDVTAPTANILFPPAVSLTEGASVIMRGTVKDEEGGSGVKSVKVNGVAATVDAAEGTWELTAAALTDGVNNLKLVVEDVAGNINEDAAHVAVTKGDITQAFPANGGVDFVGPQTVAWDNLDGRNRALVMDVDAKALVVVDLNSGIRSVLANGFIFESKDDSGNPAVPFGAIAIDKSRKKVFSAQTAAYNTFGNYSEIVSIDLNSGEKANAFSGPIVDAPADIVIDKSEQFDRLFLSSTWEGNIVTWDILGVGGVSYYSNVVLRLPNDNFPFSNSGGLALDRARNRLLMTSLNGPAFVYAIDVSKASGDLASGARSDFSNSTKANCAEKFSDSGDKVLTSIRMDEDRSRALMVNRQQKSIIALAVSNEPAIDGSCSKFSDSTTLNALIDPYGLHIEASMNYALVIDKGQKALMAVDLESGERVFVSKSKH